MTLIELIHLEELQEKDLQEYLKDYETEKQHNNYPFLYDRDNGKYVIKRKITELRKTLLSIEKAL